MSFMGFPEKIYFSLTFELAFVKFFTFTPSKMHLLVIWFLGSTLEAFCLKRALCEEKQVLDLMLL
jgi:hypothetical protein